MEAYFEKLAALIGQTIDELRSEKPGEFVSAWSEYHDDDKMFITTHVEVAEGGYLCVVLDFDQDTIAALSVDEQIQRAVDDFATVLAGIPAA